MNDDLIAYVTEYLTTVGSGSWGNRSVVGAIAAEQRAQKQVCRVPVAHTVTASTTDGSTTVDGSTDVFTGYDDGAAITGAGIPDDTTILAVDSNCRVTLSAAATADGTDVTLTIDPDVSDLNEALARRVAANLANRNLPLGVQTQIAEFGTVANRVGGRDREVMRLEGPYRVVLV